MRVVQNSDMGMKIGPFCMRPHMAITTGTFCMKPQSLCGDFFVQSEITVSHVCEICLLVSYSGGDIRLDH